MRNFPEAAVRRAFARAPIENEQPMWTPSAEFVRRIAEAEAKTLRQPVQNLSIPALPEGELELDPCNPFFETLKKYKRGEIPGRKAAKEVVDSVVRRLTLSDEMSMQ